VILAHRFHRREIVSQSTTNGPAVQVTGPPYITLVDIDGYAIPSCDKDIPEVRREPCPADSWPRWTDFVAVKLGGRDFEHRIGGTKFGDCYVAALVRADDRADGFEEAMDALDAELPLPPVSGGSPEPFTPSEEDWHEYREHFDRVERSDPELLWGYE
jgi:hypothetical protein